MQGLPPKPTCTSIVAGVTLAIAILVSFALIPTAVKWVGAVLGVLPDAVGLIEVATAREVIRVDMSTSPTALRMPRAGTYALYTGNIDLLSIHEAVLSARAKPWFRVLNSDGEGSEISLVERGLAFYDTPFAEGTPVALIVIGAPGGYTMTHPTRPAFAYLVPDYTSDREDEIVAYMLVQAAALALGGWYLRKTTRKKPTRVMVPPPTRETRERFEYEREVADAAEHRMAGGCAGHADQRADRFAVTLPPVSGRDVLGMLRDGKLSVEAARGEIEAALLAQAAGSAGLGWGEALALSPAEMAAFSQGADVRDLLRFRQNGWPAACARCGQAIDLSSLRWWVTKDPSGDANLRHIECPRPQPGTSYQF